MGKVEDSITPDLSQWIERQHMFFVATAPLAGRWSASKGEEGLSQYRQKKNAHSLDGLPGLAVDERRQ